MISLGENLQTSLLYDTPPGVLWWPSLTTLIPSLFPNTGGLTSSFITSKFASLCLKQRICILTIGNRSQRKCW